MQRSWEVGLALTEGKRRSLDRLVADLHRLQQRFELAIDRALAAAQANGARGAAG